MSETYWCNVTALYAWLWKAVHYFICLGQQSRPVLLWWLSRAFETPDPQCCFFTGANVTHTEDTRSLFFILQSEHKEASLARRCLKSQDCVWLLCSSSWVCGLYKEVGPINIDCTKVNNISIDVSEWENGGLIAFHSEALWFPLSPQ